MPFLTDIKTGRVAEEAVCMMYEKAGAHCHLNPAVSRADMAGWDVMVEGEGLTVRVEIKHDLYEAKSGNVAVEYRNSKSGKPAGIAGTIAELWVFVLADGSIWACRSTDLKVRLEILKAVKTIKGGGDGNADMKIFNRVELFDLFFFRLDDLPAEELLAMTKAMVMP